MISAKCWSEWQDLNLRPLVPNEALCNVHAKLYCLQYFGSDTAGDGVFAAETHF